MVNDQLQWMYDLERFGVKPGLEVMQEMMKVFSHPEKKWPSVHIAGTNGKGSTAALMASVLQEAGFKVGLYTSPHLMRFNERVQVNGVQIPDVELVALVREMREKLEIQKIQATFFEFTTALAFIYFAQQRVDIAVIEVGMGGRLDATNVVTPLLSVVTNIGFDHEKILGNTLEKIATEKGGIIKVRVPVVIGEKKPGIVDFFKQMAQAADSLMRLVSQEAQVVLGKETFDAQTFSINNLHLAMPLLGRHQLDNAATAYLALYVLVEKGWHIQDEHIQRGFQKTVWPGRMQIVSRQPLIIVDGAHNEDGAWVLYDYVKNFSRHDVLVLAVKKGKNPTVMLDKVAPLFKQVIVTEGTYEPWPADKLAALVRGRGASVKVEKDVVTALLCAREVLPADGLMLVTGSLYMVGHAIPLDYLR